MVRLAAVLEVHEAQDGTDGRAFFRPGAAPAVRPFHRTASAEASTAPFRGAASVALAAAVGAGTASGPRLDLEGIQAAERCHFCGRGGVKASFCPPFYR